MGERYYAVIEFGGAIPDTEALELIIDAIDYAGLLDLETDEMMNSWKALMLLEEKRLAGESVKLFDYEASWGHFEDLEKRLRRYQIPYVVDTDYDSGDMLGKHRSIYDGNAEGKERDIALLDYDPALSLTDLEKLKSEGGSIDDAIAKLKPYEFTVPPITFTVGEEAA